MHENRRTRIHAHPPKGMRCMCVRLRVCGDDKKRTQQAENISEKQENEEECALGKAYIPQKKTLEVW